ncbi:hypothetical protein P350_10115 [Burkholderia cepacia JBK9]|uniref:Uncharacterized protein n=1 Tax=Burkholderia orbicola (strain AU 1054) TaxID=331271 RepID=A0A0H2Y0Z4_BURO1|nr:conserved hypothetical protein [Burkholderia cenocepacia HI2424]ALX11876.1 hypothetical protein P350_10115 [Burkholderia cepacia JBK9]PNO74607.1 hypothetical protein DK10_014230 [Burkholderia cenocepacia]
MPPSAARGRAAWNSRSTDCGRCSRFRWAAVGLINEHPENLLQLPRASASILGGICIDRLEQANECNEEGIGDGRLTRMLAQISAITENALDEFDLVSGKFVIAHGRWHNGENTVGQRRRKTDVRRAITHADLVKRTSAA